MAAAITTIVSIVAFILVLWMLRIVPLARRAISITTDTLAALRDEKLTEQDREQAAQKASIALLGVFFGILLRSAPAVAASMLPIRLAGLAGFATDREVIEFLLRPDVIAATTAILVVIYFVGTKPWLSK